MHGSFRAEREILLAHRAPFMHFGQTLLGRRDRGPYANKRNGALRKFGNEPYIISIYDQQSIERRT